MQIVDGGVPIVAAQVPDGSNRTSWRAQGVADRAMVRLTTAGRADDMFRLVVRLQHTNRARIVTRAVRNAPGRGEQDERDESGRSAKPGQGHKQFQISILPGCFRSAT